MADYLTGEGVDLGNDAEYQKMLRQRLLDRMQQQERGMEADAVLSKEAAAGSHDLAKNLGLANIFSKGAAQIGAINGKVADASPTEEYSKELLAGAQNQDRALSEATANREKLNQYLMGKMLDQEGALGKARYEQQKLDAEEAQNAIKNRQKDREIATAAEAAKNKTREGTQVPGSVAADLGQFDSALKMADDAFSSYKSKASEFGSGLKSMAPGSDANQYEKERDVTAQAIGTILEGGKLTEPDYNRYKSMLPSPWDTNAVAEAKVQAIKNLIETKRQGKIEGLRQTGFDVANVPTRSPEGFKQASPKSGTATAATQKMNNDDIKALNWAKSNPNDPRSKAIIERLKGKGL